MRSAKLSPSVHGLVALSVLALGVLASGGIPSPDLGIPWLYKGLAVWAFAWAGLDAFGIGANDVANSFANAVAAKTITYGQAAGIACVAEFVGAIALGKNVTDTIRKKIVAVDRFSEDPYTLMLGMSCTSIGSAVWVLSATYFGMPVSTTHATVGAVMGVGIAAFGVEGVNWGYDGGFGGIVASWFISPAVAGVLASIIYLSVKYFVLNQPDEVSFKRGILSLPPYSFVTFGIVTGFMIFKGIPLASDFSDEYEKSIPTVFGIGLGMAIITSFTVVPWVRRFISDNENLPWWTMPIVMCVPVGKYGYYEEGTHDMSTNAAAARAAKGGDVQTPSDSDANMSGQQALNAMANAHQQRSPTATTPMGVSQQMPFPVQPSPMGMPYGVPPYGQMGAYGQPPVRVMGQGFGAAVLTEDPIKALDEDRPRVNGVPMYYTTNDKWYDTIFRKVAPGFYIDIDALCDECAELHSHANHFYDKTERLYKVLQISTCSFSSLSHGANDIANAIGPLSAVWAIYSTGLLNSKSPVEAWVLAYGGLWLDVGLITMGHNIMMVLGNKVTYQTPSRGFCMELGAMFTVLIFSKLGVPVSTTHCISGATAGVGLCNGDARALNWRMIAIILGGWIITCPAAGIITGLIFWGLATTPKPTPGNGFFGTERIIVETPAPEA